MWITPETIEKHRKNTEISITPLVEKYDRLFKKHNIKALSNDLHKSWFWKQIVAMNMYGDLLFKEKNLKILEIGGGVSFLTEELRTRHDYKVIDICYNKYKGINHPFFGYNLKIEKPLSIIDRSNDWYYNNNFDQYDIIIANDLFPNVDQRLYQFISKYKLHTKEIRLSLTYNAMDSFWHVKTNYGEELTIRPWNVSMISEFLQTNWEFMDGKENVWAKYENMNEIFKSDTNVMTIKMNF